MFAWGSSITSFLILPYLIQWDQITITASKHISPLVSAPGWWAVRRRRWRCPWWGSVPAPGRRYWRNRCCRSVGWRWSTAAAKSRRKSAQIEASKHYTHTRTHASKHTQPKHHHVKITNIVMKWTWSESRRLPKTLQSATQEQEGQSKGTAEGQTDQSWKEN